LETDTLNRPPLRNTLGHDSEHQAVLTGVQVESSSQSLSIQENRFV